MSRSSSNASSTERPTAAAVIVAGGSGQRMGGVRKQYMDLLGEPVLLRAVRPFLEHPAIGAVVVVLPQADVAQAPGWLSDLPVTLTGGGAERGDSVWAGLRELPSETEVVLVHDGARPFVTAAILDRVLGCAYSGGVVAAMPATDTMKLVRENGEVERTLPRTRIWHAQTPQGFPLRPLMEAYRRAREEGWTETDDSAVYERFGLPVVVVEGSSENIKITRPGDLPIAEALARRARRSVAVPPHGEG